MAVRIVIVVAVAIVALALGIALKTSLVVAKKFESKSSVNIQ